MSLRNLAFENHDQALDIAKFKGEVIGVDKENAKTKDPRFCVNLQVKERWVTNIGLNT